MPINGFYTYQDRAQAPGGDPNLINAYVQWAQGAGRPAREQFLTADYLKNTDQATLMNNLASLYNTYGPPQGGYNAFAPNAQGGYDDPAVDLMNRFINFRDTYRDYINQKAPQLMEAFKPYLGDTPVKAQPYNGLNPYYDPNARVTGG